METIDMFRSKWAEAEADPEVTAMVITAEKTGIFSGGLGAYFCTNHYHHCHHHGHHHCHHHHTPSLDLKEFHQPDVERLKRYWGGVQGLMTDVFESPLYTVNSQTHLTLHSLS